VSDLFGIAMAVQTHVSLFAGVTQLVGSSRTGIANKRDIGKKFDC